MYLFNNEMATNEKKIAITWDLETMLINKNIKNFIKYENTFKISNKINALCKNVYLW